MLKCEKAVELNISNMTNSDNVEAVYNVEPSIIGGIKYNCPMALWMQVLSAN